MGLILPGKSSPQEPVPRTRRRLSRTLSRDRFLQYRTLLRTALGRDYSVVSLERFLDDPQARAHPRVLILRHDVDQCPASALRMAEIERALGVRSTWYLRWRTADPAVVQALREHGGEIGLHYETLTRRALTIRATGAGELESVLEDCRTELRAEIASFAEHFGPNRSVCAHGDTRVPWARNLALLDGQDLATYGVVHDANLALRTHKLGAWLTDRSSAEGSWGDGQDPGALLRDGVSPILCLTHPNNWVSGPALWRDRLMAAGLPTPAAGRSVRLTRTRSDNPPA